MRMNIVLTFTIVFAAIMMIVAVMNRHKCSQLLNELDDSKTKLNDLEDEKDFLQQQVSILTQRGGISESTIFALAGEITRMENNLHHMEEVPGRKQVMKALDRMKSAFQAEEYTIVPLLGHPYVEGMNVKAVFVPDEGLEEGTSVIVSVQKPQVNYRGKMIQAATITVGQNIQ